MKYIPYFLKVTPDLIRKNGAHTLTLSERAIARVRNQLTQRDEPRCVIVYNVIPSIITSLECTFAEALSHAAQLRRAVCLDVFRFALAMLESELNPHCFRLVPSEFEVEGYGVNKEFMGFPEDFYTTKRLHFDIVEPLSSNLYGPNFNISGGFPVFADVGRYCRESHIEPNSILEKIPGTRLLTISTSHYSRILRSYTTAYRLNMETDTPFTLYVNSIAYAGIMHGATDPTSIDSNLEARRPLSHLSLDSDSVEDAIQWYADLGQKPGRAEGDPAQRFLLTDGIEVISVPTIDLV